MKKAKKEELYPNNLIEEILHQKITGQMSAEFTERFEKIVLSAVGKERFSCIRCRYHDGLTYREAGELCGNIPASRVRNLIETAMRRLAHPRIRRSIREILRQELAENPELEVSEKPESVSDTSGENHSSVFQSSYDYCSERKSITELEKYLDCLSLSECSQAVSDLMGFLQQKYPLPDNK
ncbi:MAG: hypothetical protein K2J32_13140 [Ruminococcus sp.]|nr:hypothetical protein [Ruminococcus sp.]